jgi:hypothetical protein
MQTKVQYADKEIELPFEIGTCSIVEIDDELVFFPLSKCAERQNNQVYREVYSTKFSFINGQFDIRYESLRKRMSMPKDMQTNSKIIYQKHDK